MDKISILVPCCNVEKYVRECLESIQNQTYKNLEVICIDDGSKDSTGQIIDEYVVADSRFKVIHKPNSGYGDSMNKGLEACTGDYVGIVESDDWIEPNMFETLLKTAKENDLDLVRCCWNEGPTGTESQVLIEWVDKNEVYCPLDREGVFLQSPAIWVNLYRRDLLEEGRKVRFLPTPGASYQDTSFAFKVYTKSKRFMMLDKPLHHYRINPNSSVSSTGKVYCIIDEWEEMRRWVCEDSLLHKRFRNTPLLAHIWYGGMMWNYERLSLTVLKLLFLRRASKLFRQAASDGVFCPEKLSDPERVSHYLKIMKSPLDFHHDKISEVLNFLPKAKDNIVTDDNELISVVVTCYNTSNYIFSSLTSILQQNYKNIEILCVDDCSTDDTAVLVRHMMRLDKRIKWLSTPKNSGLSASRNLALSHCNGRYVMFVDGDDCLYPDAIARLYRARENDEVVAGTIVAYYEGGESQYGALVESDNNYYRIKKSGQANVFKDIDTVYDVNVSACGKLWNMSVIREKGVSFPEGLLYEDACFYWKYLCVAPNISMVKEPVYLYHRHKSGSIMSDTFVKKPGMAINHIYIIDNIHQFASKKGLQQEIKVILQKIYEPYFWFAYNNSPVSDLDMVLETMNRILREQNADTSKSNILNYITTYEKASKGDLFMKAIGQTQSQTSMSPDVYRLQKKLRKYRRLTKLLAVVASLLLILLVVALFL